MSINEMEAKAQQLRELRRMADELAAEIAAIEDEFKAYMTANETVEISGTTFKITWKPVSSTRLDSKAVKEQAPDLYKQCSKTSTSRRFLFA